MAEGPGTVYPIVVGRVAAMVSEASSPFRLTPAPRHLDAQSRVLAALHERSRALIPARFGHVLPNVRAITRLLADRQTELIRALSAQHGKIEMTLTVTWEVPDLFEHIAEGDPELSSLHQAICAERREPTRAEQMEMSRSFNKRINELRKAYTRRVSRALDGYVDATAEDRVFGAREVMRLALLMDRPQDRSFDEHIRVLACEFPDAVTFTYEGPYAPFRFATLDLERDAVKIDAHHEHRKAS